MIRQRLGFEGRIVLALGRLATNKGYDLLIDAFSVVARARAGRHAASRRRRREHGRAGTRILDELKEQVKRARPRGQASFLRLCRRRGSGGQLPRRRHVRPVQPLRAVRHDGDRGDGLRHADGRHDPRRPVSRHQLRPPRAVRRSLRQGGSRHHDDEAVQACRGSTAVSGAWARTRRAACSPGPASRSS